MAVQECAGEVTASIRQLTQIDHAGFAGFRSHASSVPAASQPSALTGPVARLLAQHLGAVVDPHQQNGAIGESCRDHLLLGMAGHRGDAHAERREHLRLLAHRAFLALERPQHELLRAGGRKPLAAGGPAERAHPRRITGHPHVLGIDHAPAMQRRLLHRCNEKLAVRAERRVMVRALPFQEFRRRLRVRKPHRHAVVMGDRQPHALRRKGDTAGGGLHLDRFRLARPGLHEGLLTGRPRHRAVRAAGDMIDPAALGIGRNEAAVALGVRRKHLAVVAAGDDRHAIARGRQDAAAMDGEPLLVGLVGNQQHGLLAERNNQLSGRIKDY